jgi:HK97 family phage prohead protease
VGLMETKAFATEFKVSNDGRTVEGYASTFGNVDQVGDVVVEGAYKRTLQHRMGRIKVLRDHEHPIGVPVRALEDSKGLYTESRISDTQLGNETLTLLRDGVLDRMSIGYEPVTKEMGKHEGKEVRFLKEIKLYEWSIVTFPANESAAVTGVKALEDLDRLFHDFKAGRITAQQLADACLKASPEPAPLDAPADQPLALDPDTSDSAAVVAEIKAMLGDYQSYFRRAA